MNAHKLRTAAISLLTMLSVALFSWAWQTQGEIRELRQRMTAMEDQRVQMRKFWQFTRWSYMQLFVLRRAADMPDVDFPKLD